MYSDCGDKGLGTDDFVMHINNTYDILTDGYLDLESLENTTFKQRVEYVCKRLLDEDNSSRR